MWIKIICTGYILIENSMYDVTDMLKKLTVKHVSINNFEL